jgi:hypothetical protein
VLCSAKFDFCKFIRENHQLNSSYVSDLAYMIFGLFSIDGNIVMCFVGKYRDTVCRSSNLDRNFIHAEIY